MGWFKKSESAVPFSDGLAIEVTNGWSVIEGNPKYLNFVEHQKTLNKLFDAVGNSNVPVRLKFDPHDKESVPVHSRIGIVGKLLAEAEVKAWIKRIDAAAGEKKFYVGTVHLNKNKETGFMHANLYINRPDEIAVNIESVPVKAIKQEQVSKQLAKLIEIAETYPETNAGVKSQAKKAVKIVASLYGHALSLDESTDDYKESLKDLCSTFILECERCADSEDEIGSDIEYFVQCWNECVTKTGAYTPVIPSDFSIADNALLDDTPELALLLKGKSIVLSGDFKEFSRTEGESAIKRRGGKSPGSISSKTYALVIGTNPGDSKKAKALELNIPIIEVEQFFKILQTGEVSVA